MQNTLIEFTSANIWRRLGAIIYDTLIVIALWMVVGFLMLSSFGITEAQTLEGETVVLDPLYKNLLFASMLMSAFIFFSWFWTHSGQTLGMQAWKIKVQNADGSAVNLKQCLIRFVIAPFSFCCFGAGYFYLFFNPEKQTLHDKLSSSHVVKVLR